MRGLTHLKTHKVNISKLIAKAFFGFFLFVTKPFLLVNIGLLNPLGSDQVDFVMAEKLKWTPFQNAGGGQGARGCNVSIRQSIGPQAWRAQESRGSLLKMLGPTTEIGSKERGGGQAFEEQDSCVWF